MGQVKFRVEECVLTATRTMYALFGAGLHGKNGLNPVISKKLWSTYIIPRMLYSTELWQLNSTDTEKLEIFQRARVKQIQGLLIRTSNTTVLGLLGMLLVQADVHKRVLVFSRTLIDNKDSLEWEICLRSRLIT